MMVFRTDNSSTVFLRIFSAEKEKFDLILGCLHQCLMSQVLGSEQKWWLLFGKYWLVKNGRNDDDVKLMKWLMTGRGGSRDDRYMRRKCRLYCDEMSGKGRVFVPLCLVESKSINTPAKALKLELGSQLPVKSYFKYNRDVIKRASSNNGGRHIVGLNSNMQCNWSNKHGDIVCEYKDIGHMELALPNSKNDFLDECVMQD